MRKIGFKSTPHANTFYNNAIDLPFREGDRLPLADQSANYLIACGNH